MYIYMCMFEYEYIKMHTYILFMQPEPIRYGRNHSSCKYVYI